MITNQKDRLLKYIMVIGGIIIVFIGWYLHTNQKNTQIEDFNMKVKCQEEAKKYVGQDVGASAGSTLLTYGYSKSQNTCLAEFVWTSTDRRSNFDVEDVLNGTVVATWSGNTRYAPNCSNYSNKCNSEKDFDSAVNVLFEN